MTLVSGQMVEQPRVTPKASVGLSEDDYVRLKDFAESTRNV
jgi:hypothetical protein